MADYDLYQKGKEGWDWGREERVEEDVNCKNADVSSRLSAKLYIKQIVCQENANINVDHSAYLKITKLVCKSGTINVSYSSTLEIRYIECVGTLDIQDAYSSTMALNVDGGTWSPKIGTTTGVVRYSSLAIKFPNCSIGQDTVTTEYASTWDKQ